jgi:serine/threonine protein kinase
MQLIHFDIKPANILLDSTWTQAKVSDVGTSHWVTINSLLYFFLHAFSFHRRRHKTASYTHTQIDTATTHTHNMHARTHAHTTHALTHHTHTHTHTHTHRQPHRSNQSLQILLVTLNHKTITCRDKWGCMMASWDCGGVQDCRSASRALSLPRPW